MTQSLDNNSGYGDTERADHVPPLPLPTRLLEAVAVSSMMSAIAVVPEPNGRHRKKGILTEPGWCGGGTTRQLKDTNKPDQWQLRRTQNLGSGKSLGKLWRRINQTYRNSGKPCGASGQGINLPPKERGKLLTSISSIPLTCLP